MGDRITIKEIAEKAKVSTGTVDRVLHNRGEVSQKTRERILQIVQEGNYEPNLHARQLVLNRTFLITSMLPRHQEKDYWAYPEAGIRQAVSEFKTFGIRNRICYFEEEDTEDFERVAREVFMEMPDGVLLAPTIFEKAVWMAGECCKRDIPLVLLDSDLPVSQRLAYIGQDAYRSGYLAAKLLHFSGDIRRLYIANISRLHEKNELVKQRKKGFLSYFQEHSIELEIKEINLKVEQPGFKTELNKVAAGFQPGEGVFATNSKLHLLAGALPEGSGRQLRMIGYDLIEKNIHFLENGTIDFLINQKPELQGYTGMQVLYKHLVLKQEVGKRVFMPLEIITKENLQFI